MEFFKKKSKPAVQEPMDLDAVMKKYDRESNVRVWEGKQKIIVTCVLAAFSIFCLYVTLFASWLEEIRLTTFVAWIVVIGFIVFPAQYIPPSTLIQFPGFGSIRSTLLMAIRRCFENSRNCLR